MRCSCNQQTSG